ncbi:MAG: ribosomal-processing cysteine protease Prp [Atopostipes sp.]|nr:ribosomal-processing cysteine protease Prp [Atopostipes sp.]
MIYAKFTVFNNNIDSFVLSGHANSGPLGHDLVCAASSALAIGTTNNLYRILSKEPNVRMNEKDGGYLELFLPSNLNKKEKEQSQLLLEALYYSLLDVESEHGKHITVSKVTNEQL